MDVRSVTNTAKAYPTTWTQAKATGGQTPLGNIGRQIPIIRTGEATPASATAKYQLQGPTSTQRTEASAKLNVTPNVQTKTQPTGEPQRDHAVTPSGAVAPQFAAYHANTKGYGEGNRVATAA